MFLLIRVSDTIPALPQRPKPKRVAVSVTTDNTRQPQMSRPQRVVGKR